MTDAISIPSSTNIEPRSSTSAKAPKDDAPADAFAMLLASLQAVIPAVPPAVTPTGSPPASAGDGEQPATVATVATAGLVAGDLAAPAPMASAAPATTPAPAPAALTTVPAELATAPAALAEAPAALPSLAAVTVGPAPKSETTGTETTGTETTGTGTTGTGTTSTGATGTGATVAAPRAVAEISPATTAAATHAPQRTDDVPQAPAIVTSPQPSTTPATAPTGAATAAATAAGTMQHDVAPADGTAAPDTTDPNAANARPGAAPLADRPTQRADAATTAAPVEGIAAATEPAQGDDTDTTTSADAPGGAEAGTAPTTVDAPAPGAHRVTATADTSRRGGEGAPSSNADGNRNHPPTASPDDVGRPSQLTPLTTHGARHLSISMEHEQLGAIRIGAAEDRGTINISLQADDASAGAVLREHATRLSDHLALSGVAVGQVEVRHGDGFAHRHAQSTPAEFMPDAGRTGTDDDPSPTGPRLIRPSLDPDRRVDLLL